MTGLVHWSVWALKYGGVRERLAETAGAALGSTLSIRLVAWQQFRLKAFVLRGILFEP